MIRTDDEIEEKISAIHEAGHIVFEHFKGIPIEYAWINGNDGLTKPTLWGALLLQIYADKACVTYLSGELTQRFYFPDIIEEHKRDTMSLNGIFNNEHHKKEAERYIREKLSYPSVRALIEKIAGALVKKKHLNELEIRTLLSD